MAEYMIYIWLAVIFVALVVEGMTAQLISIWFVPGGLAGLISGFCGAGEWVQILIGAIVTLVCLIATRPLVNRVMKFRKVDTNSGRLVGQTGVVVQEIRNLDAAGQVKIQGSVWSARSENGEVIPQDKKVSVLRIEGVKLIVKPL
ncbi:MAG TPA: NfeD family protein [Candidatus Gallacutalibacter pullistercoris]|nr:NfeD family protein [Candidatus Gallacutalibacter pullistercoris]